MNIWALSDTDLKRAAKAIKEENHSWPETMILMKDRPSEEILKAMPASGSRFIESWRSKHFLCQVYRAGEGMRRLSICRTIVDVTNRRWRDGITWDELMQVKREVGYGHLDAVEVFPADDDIINVANMRHLWLFLFLKVGFAWRKQTDARLTEIQAQPGGLIFDGKIEQYEAKGEIREMNHES